MTKLVSTPVAGSSFSIECYPPVGAEHKTTTRISIAPAGRFALTAAGQAAIMAAFATYLSGAKVTAIRARSDVGAAVFHLSESEGWCDILPEDADGLITTLNGLLVTAANVRS